MQRQYVTGVLRRSLHSISQRSFCHLMKRALDIILGTFIAFFYFRQYPWEEKKENKIYSMSLIKQISNKYTVVLNLKVLVTYFLENYVSGLKSGVVDKERPTPSIEERPN